MVESILNAVSVQLHSTFGDNYNYYVEDVKQNLTKPCFTIDMVLPLQRSKSAVLYDRTMPLVIHYFNDKQETNKKDCYRVAEQLVESLEYLPFKNTLLRGEDISWHLVDGVLQMFVTYKFTTRKVTNEDIRMESFGLPNVSVH